MIGAMFGLGFIIGPMLGGILGAYSLRLPFFVAGSLAMVNFVYGLFVLPESLPPERRRSFRLGMANPFASLAALARLKGVGLVMAVIALTALAQFTLYASWVLYTTFKFGWGPKENGWSLAVVGVVSVIVQGFLLGALLRRFSPRMLAVTGLASSALAYAAWGAATEGWMMYAIIVLNLAGFTISSVLQSIVSSAADAKSQGGVLGAVNAINSLASVAAPLFSAPLLTLVSHLTPGDWRMGVPLYFCAALQATGLVLAIMHFHRERAGAVRR
jgi:MFS transporter, DHA1 family, tetracycline resistance protein